VSRGESLSDALELQLQAAQIAIATAWNATAKSWDDPPQDVCVTAALSPDIAAAEGYRILPPRAIKAIEDGIGHRATVRPLNDCGLIATLTGLVTREGHRAWVVEYYDADAELLPGRPRSKGAPLRWVDRDDFNTNRPLEDDGTVDVSNGYMWDLYYFDFTSSEGKVHIAHGRRAFVVQ
jgi:hypothetical protein